MMTNLQFYKYAALGMLLLNIAMVAFFFITKPKGPHPGHPGQRAIAILQLDEQQNQAFLASANKHNLKMDSINLQQTKLLRPYFNGLTQSTVSIDQPAVLNQILSLERSKITSTYQHFEEVKSNLNSDQIPDFKTFMNQALEFLLINSKKGPPPPKD